MDGPMQESPHVLIVDDDRELLRLLARFLERHGLRASTARDGREMRRVLADWRIDLVVLDLMLPGEDGLALCRQLRATSEIPIIMLTAMGEETDRIIGLEMGADDYLPKPCSPRELVARIRSVLRRARAAAPLPRSRARKVLAFEGWTLDLARRRLESPQGFVVDLSPSEFELLVAFAEHPQQVLSREQLLDLAHGRGASPFDRTIDIQVSRLRRKIEPDPQRAQIITTVRGGGYLFTPAVVDAEAPDP
jgi:two-component system, OmpR family, response regulator